jgi:hypothetical protein
MNEKTPIDIIKTMSLEEFSLIFSEEALTAPASAEARKSQVNQGER